MPSTRQGRVTLIIYLGLVFVGILTLQPEQKGVFLSLAGLLTLIFIVICWIKGEPPHWCWGDKNNAQRYQDK
jgi:hypothetical protein